MSADEGAAGSEEREWRRRVMSSPEVQEVQDSLMFQRIKIRQLHMDLHEAESLDSELEERLKAQENKMKPALRRFVEKLENYGGVQQALIEEVVKEVEDTKKILSSLRKVTMKLHLMNRTQLLGHLNTLKRLCHCLRQRDDKDGADSVQEMIQADLKQLDFMGWHGMTATEWEMTKDLMSELTGVPQFAVKLAEQSLELILSGELSLN